MKKIEKIIPATKGKKTGPGSNPVNKFKKNQHTTAASIENIIKGAVGNVKPKSGDGFSDRGTVSIYDEER